MKQQGQERRQDQEKEKGMGNTPVSQQVFSGTAPERGQKIRVRQALRHGPDQQGFTAQFPASHPFPDAATQYNMRQ